MALGIDAKGRTHILGLREGSTEATRVVRPLPAAGMWAWLQLPAHRIKGRAATQAALDLPLPEAPQSPGVRN